jgi:hypothetical protein
MISYEDLEALEETLEILSERDAAQAIRESLSDPDRFSIDDIRRDLEERRGNVGDEA